MGSDTVRSAVHSAVVLPIAAANPVMVRLHLCIGIEWAGQMGHKHVRSELVTLPGRKTMTSSQKLPLLSTSR